ncbi:MAG: NAD(P)-dependent oxidoreductase [Gaiella sp.]|uniref:NAD(P)-dependent oxidoreductase n=1 Tax=Gaiella sp. TaxID=2663207 RepID=UPI003C5E1478
MRDSHDPGLAVGLIGLGNMGTAFAERLLDAGYGLVVMNRTPAKAAPLEARGATLAGSYADLAERVDVVLTSLADDDALDEVAAALLAVAKPGTVLVDTSTVSPAVSARVAERAEKASVAYTRAPVSGNPTVVRAGNLSFIVSGPSETLDGVEPILLAIGPTVYRVGDAEEARVVKLAINLMIGGLAQLMAEALVLGESSGVSRAALLEVMGGSAAGAPFVRYKTGALLEDDYSATFTTALMGKDLDLILDAAGDAGVELPVTTGLQAIVRAAIEAGYADDDFMALFPFLASTSRSHAAAPPLSQEVTQ